MDLSNRDGRRILGNRIKGAAKEAGISLDELAIRIACSRALIYQYVSGASLAQPDRLQQIAGVVGKPLSWFFDDAQTRAGGLQSTVHPTDDLSSEPLPESGRLRKRIEHLHELVAAYSSPPAWRQVADTCQQITALLGEEGSSAEIAENLFTQGNALLCLHEYSAAMVKLNEAGALFHKLELNERNLDCLQSIGHANMHLGRSSQALEAFRRVAEGDGWRNRWQGTLSLGAVHEVLGDYSSASDAFVRAQEIVAENDDAQTREIAYLYIDGNWTNLELAWGDYDRALETAKRCVKTAQRLGDQDQYIEGLLNCASAHLVLGEIRESIEQSELALNMAELNRDYERWCLGLASRSLAFSACRQAAPAILDAIEAISMALRHGAHRAEAVARRAISIACISSGNLVEARHHVVQAIAAAEAAHLRLPHAQFLILLARITLAEGDAAGAITQANRALEAAEALGAKESLHDCHLVLAEAYRQSSVWDKAADHAAKAAGYAAEMCAYGLQWQSQAVLADALARQGKNSEAEEAFRTAIDSLALSRKRCGDAASSDLLPEAPGVKDLWLGWISFLEEAGRNDESADFIHEAQWELLEAWVQEKRNGK